MKRLPLTALAFVLFSAHAYGNDDTKQDDRRIQTQNQDPLLIPPPAPPTPTPPQADGTLVVEEADLLANPELLSRAMLSALIYDNAEGVETLLPIYQKQDPAHIEPDVLVWSEAVLAGQDNPKKAAALYQTLANNNPNNPLFGVRLGQSYFANRQYLEAKQTFLTQPPTLQSELLPYLDHINAQQRPQLHFGGNFLSDKNINNAPTNSDLGGGWTASPPEAAHGVYLNANSSKRLLSYDGFFVQPELSLTGKLYWDARHYNEATARLSAGLGKQTARTSLSLSPFAERTYYAGGKKETPDFRHFSNAMGATLNLNTRLGNNQLSVFSELSYNTYQERKHLNGYSLALSPTITFYPQANTAVSLGSDHQYTHTQDKDDSYRRTGFRASMARQWNDFGVRGSVGLARRTYLAPMPIFNQVQQNREYNASLSVWHNRLSYKGLTPRLTWQYQKTNSSIALYSYDKSRVFVELNAGF